MRKVKDIKKECTFLRGKECSRRVGNAFVNYNICQCHEYLSSSTERKALHGPLICKWSLNCRGRW